jgi:hypothetical protein
MTTRPVSRSWITNANMPCRCETTSVPHRWKPLRITSVSLWEKKR